MLTRLLSHPLRRFQSKYVLAEVIDGKLEEAKFEIDKNKSAALEVFEIRRQIGSPAGL